MKNILIILLCFCLFQGCSGDAEKSEDATADTVPVPGDSTRDAAITAGNENSLSGARSATADSVAGMLLKKYNADITSNVLDSFSRSFAFDTADLNGDAKPEMFIATRGSYFCGSGGCTILLLSPNGELINTFTVSDYPLFTESGSTKGWKNLIIHSNKQDRLLKFDGKKYPSNPSVVNGKPVASSVRTDTLLNPDDPSFKWFTF